MKKLWIIAVLALAGCIGPPFVGVEPEDDDAEVLILETGVWQAPPEQDVCVPLPKGGRSTPDAGRR